MTGTVLPGAAHNTNGARSWLARMLDGGHPWGDLLVGYVDRSGGIRYQLVLFPAGTTTDQRRALVFHRRWLPWGVILGFLVASGLSTVMNGWAAIGIAGLIYVGGLVVANAYAGNARHGVVELRVQVLTLLGEREVFGQYGVVEDAVNALTELDELAAADEIDAVEYELRWGEIYREVVAGAEENTRPRE